MDVSQRNRTKKGNKENAQPVYGSKPSITRNGSKTVSVAPPHLKSIERQSNKRGDSTQGDMQAVKQKKILEAAKPPVPQPHAKPAPQPHAKPAPGLYKGKVVQSKIGSIWKSSVVAKEGDQKPTVKPSTASAVQRQRVDNFTKMRSRSVADLPGRADQKPKSTRSNSVSGEPLPVPKRPVTGRPPTGLRSAPPRTTRPVAPSSARTGAVVKGTETKVVRDKKVNKPPVSSSLSQYRVPMESADERRAKLADWLASKGKALKRPVMFATIPAKSKVPIKHPEPKPSQDPTVVAAAVVPVLSANQPGETVRVEDPASDASSSPLTMNATLDLLDNSDLDLPVDPEPRVNDIVVNLCEALSALATNEDEPQQKDQSDDCEVADGPSNEVKEDVETESAKYSEEEEDDCKEYEIDDKEEEEEETKRPEVTPTGEDASSVKYNVKTTPYLQSVKKGLQGEVHSACSRKKPGIKDLKFLTPVRRSSRIHRNSSRLPPMVLDHDPCVTSLAELVQLDDAANTANAYIYRKNPALFEDSQDPKKELLSDSKYF